MLSCVQPYFVVLAIWQIWLVSTTLNIDTIDRIWKCKWIIQCYHSFVSKILLSYNKYLYTPCHPPCDVGYVSFPSEFLSNVDSKELAKSVSITDLLSILISFFGGMGVGWGWGIIFFLEITINCVLLMLRNELFTLSHSHILASSLLSTPWSTTHI